jgi:hypothetical protein
VVSQEPLRTALGFFLSQSKAKLPKEKKVIFREPLYKASMELVPQHKSMGIFLI